MIWSGSPKNIPKGWLICDGENKTPDLRGRFIVGEGGRDQFIHGNTGGTTKHSHQIEVESHKLTIDEMPRHSHSGVYGNKNFPDNTEAVYVGEGDKYRYVGKNYCAGTAYVGGGAAHKHNASSQDRSHLPPYYTLCYIMKKE